MGIISYKCTFIYNVIKTNDRNWNFFDTVSVISHYPLCVYLSGEVFDVADFYNRTAHRFEDMVQYCQWKGAPCEKTSWEEDYTHYSKCYTFNKHGDHKLLKAGSGEWNVLKMLNR